MKTFQRFCAIAVLVVTLALSAFAGEIGMPGVTNPPPPPQQSSVAGDMGTPGATATGDIQFPGVTSLDPVTEAALSLLQSILSLF